jgi:hypothetical protein
MRILEARAWMVDQFSLGRGADPKYRHPARSSVSSDQQLCLLHLRYRTGRQLSSLCRSTFWVGSGRPNSDHSKSSRISSNGLWRGHGGSRDKRPLCLLDSILAPQRRRLGCASRPCDPWRRQVRQWNSMDWTAARRGYTTQTVLRKGPEWLLSGKPAAAADMPGRLSVTLTGRG